MSNQKCSWIGSNYRVPRANNLIIARGNNQFHSSKVGVIKTSHSPGELENVRIKFVGYLSYKQGWIRIPTNGYNCFVRGQILNWALFDFLSREDRRYLVVRWLCPTMQQVPDPARCVSSLLISFSHHFSPPSVLLLSYSFLLVSSLGAGETLL